MHKKLLQQKREKIDQLCQLYGSIFFPSQFQHWEKVASLSDLIIHMLIHFFLSLFSFFIHIKDLPFKKHSVDSNAHILYVTYILAAE